MANSSQCESHNKFVESKQTTLAKLHANNEEFYFLTLEHYLAEKGCLREIRMVSFPTKIKRTIVYRRSIEHKF